MLHHFAHLTLATVSALGDGPVTAVTDYFDVVEVNHFHDDVGKQTFSQLIFYRWNDRANRYQIHAWRLIKSDLQLPVRTSPRGPYVCCWRDGKLMRVVYANSFRETWTTHDPESTDRVRFAKELRPDLSTIPRRQAWR